MEGKKICSKCHRDTTLGILYSGGLCRTCHQEKLLSFAATYKYKKVNGAKPTIFQTLMYHKLKECSEFKMYLTAAEVKKIFHCSHIPSSLHKIFLQEMKDLKLIKHINMNQIKVL